MSTYSRYKRNDYELAIASALRYIELYPSSENVDYAYYLIAISYYEQINDIARDQGNTQRALAAFDELIARFPDGEYARDGRAKRDLALDHLAGKEMEVGRTYLGLKQYLASIKRFQTVIEKYQSTSHVPEALARITEVYLILGVKEEAQAAAATLHRAHLPFCEFMHMIGKGILYICKEYITSNYFYHGRTCIIIDIK